MAKPARLWVGTAPTPRAVVPRGLRAIAPAPRELPVHLSWCCQAAELAGPWLLRAAVRVPLPRGVPSSSLRRSLWMGALHVRWLRHMGIAPARGYEGPPVAHWASFGARLPGDVLLGQQKITSVCEMRRGHEALLVASTLLNPTPWPLLCTALGREATEAVALDHLCVCASSALAHTVDARAWAAGLRSMLHIALTLGDLQEEMLGAE